MYKLWEHKKLLIEDIERLKYVRHYGIFPKSMIPNIDGFNLFAILSSGAGCNDAQKCTVKDGGQGCFLPDVDYGKVIGYAWREPDGGCDPADLCAGCRCIYAYVSKKNLQL